jgi:hypothetical protein
LAGTNAAGALIGVIHDDGDGVTSLQLTQISERRGKLTVGRRRVM